MRYRRALALLLVCGTVLLSSCAPEEKELALAGLLPAEWTPYATYRLDTNGDMVDEWAVLYTYDQQENQAFTPVGHASRARPCVHQLTVQSAIRLR